MKNLSIILFLIISLFFTSCGGGDGEDSGGFVCCDGSISHASHRQGACSHHGGICDADKPNSGGGSDSSNSHYNDGNHNSYQGGNNNSNNYPKYTYYDMELLNIEDGDTYKFSHNGNEVTCRVHGIDTPESYDTEKLDRIANRCGVSKSDIQDAGDKAKLFVENYLIQGHTYKIAIVNTDQYSRKVCKILYNDNFFGKKIVFNGYAVVLENYITNSNEKKDYKTYEDYANSHNYGLWQSYRKLMECMTNY